MSNPSLVYADESGRIFDHPGLSMAGMAGGGMEPVQERDLIPLPPGSELFLLPGRLPMGYSPGGELEVLSEDPSQPGGKVTAVAAFMAPAHTAIFNAAYHTLDDAPLLPLFAYTAVGFHRGGFVVAGQRVDPLPRQDPERFNQERITSSARRLLKRFKDNRLWQHLGTCALTYCCPAARNLMLGRWEAPLPTSRTCNASCFGCLSLQPEDGFPATQDRINFRPEPHEVAEVAGFHLSKATSPLVSFGQGCEGEPLTEGELLEESIRLVRLNNHRGTINLNTNGSRPDVVAKLMRAGLSSIRVSLNSLLPERHQAYYQPAGWGLEQAIASILEVKRAGGFASINLLTMPGVTDRFEEVEALYSLVERTKLDLIQWRNLNIDPEAYLDLLDLAPPDERMGISQLIAELKRRYPDLSHGYFNPHLTPGGTLP